MKVPFSIAVVCILVSASAGSTDTAPAVSAETPSGFTDPGIRFGSVVEGNRIGLWSERATYGLRHLPNVWVAVDETGKPLLPPAADSTPNVTHLPAHYVVLVHPDGSESREEVGWPADGPTGYGWMGAIGNALYPAIQAPGAYTVRVKVANLEAGPITFEVVPEADDFIADSRLGVIEALRKARGVAAQVIRADATKHGYEPLFEGGRDDGDETWVTFAEQFNDGHDEKPSYAIIAYNKTSGAVSWVPIE